MPTLPSSFVNWGLGLLSTTIVGIVTWGASLTGRTVALETKVEAIVDGESKTQEFLEKLINQRFDATDARIGRIERSMNGHLSKG